MSTRSAVFFRCDRCFRETEYDSEEAGRADAAAKPYSVFRKGGGNLYAVDLCGPCADSLAAWYGAVALFDRAAESAVPVLTATDDPPISPLVGGENDRDDAGSDDGAGT